MDSINKDKKMTDIQTELEWDAQAFDHYLTMIKKIPLFHREIAKTVVNKKAENNAQVRGSQKVEEGDIVKAFFSEVPMTFYSLMIRLLEDSGFDYKKYE